jgi:hypothetical protein
MKRLFIFAFAAVTLIATSIPVFAGPELHAGMSLDPDDFLVGLRWNKPLENNLSLVPSVEAGFGDVTMIAGNLDLHYQFETSSKLKPYAGGGMTLNWFDFDDESDTEFGGSILGGITLSPKLYFEAKFGLGDVPDVKLVIGFRKAAS